MNEIGNPRGAKAKRKEETEGASFRTKEAQRQRFWTIHSKSTMKLCENEKIRKESEVWVEVRAI
jgi:hypothetical protein